MSKQNLWLQSQARRETGPAGYGGTPAYPSTRLKSPANRPVRSILVSCRSRARARCDAATRSTFLQPIVEISVIAAAASKLLKQAGSGDWRGERKNKRREAEAEAAKGVSGASRIGRLSGRRDASEGGRGRERRDGVRQWRTEYRSHGCCDAASRSIGLIHGWNSFDGVCRCKCGCTTWVEVWVWVWE